MIAFIFDMFTAGLLIELIVRRVAFLGIPLKYRVF